MSSTIIVNKIIAQMVTDGATLLLQHRNSLIFCRVTFLNLTCSKDQGQGLAHFFCEYLANSKIYG